MAVKIFSFEDKVKDEDFRIDAFSYTRNLWEKFGCLNNYQTNVCRLVNAEGDGITGLIIDD